MLLLKDFKPKFETAFKHSCGRAFGEEDDNSVIYLTDAREGPIFNVFMTFKVSKLFADRSRPYDLNYLNQAFSFYALSRGIYERLRHHIYSG